MRLSALVLLLALCALACNRQAPPPVPTTPTTKEPRANRPTKEEVIEYIDGKAINLGEPKSKDGKLHTLKRNEIEALQVSDSASSVDGGPWHTTVTFIVSTDSGRYGCKGSVQFRIVEQKCAFFGFEINEVAKQ